MSLCSIVHRLLLGQSDADEAVVYESYQSILQTLMMISTLLMGFIITGAFIGIGYSGDATFEQRQLVEFVAISFKAFILALVSLSLCLILSVIGAQIHALPGCVNRATRFLVIFSWVVVLAECCVYACSVYTLEFIGTYVTLIYVSPSTTLCPGLDPKTDHTTKNFCAQVSIDFFNAAADKDMCGPPQVQPRRFNSSNDTASVCSQLDYAAKGTEKAPDGTYKDYFFGWDEDDNYTQQLFQPTYSTDRPPKNVANTVAMNAKVLGEFMCLVDKAQSIKKQACGPTPASTIYQKASGTSCATAILAAQAADTCAGGKAADLTKCRNACAWALKWSFLGQYPNISPNYVSVAEAYEPIFKVIKSMQACIMAWAVARIILALLSFAYICWYYSGPDKEDPDDLDDSEDGLDDGSYKSIGKNL